MNKLTTKVHYEHYEASEFSDVAIRTLEETKALVKAHVWKSNGLITFVGIDRAGIVIEGVRESFLKIGDGYNDHYKVYNYTTSGKYYSGYVKTMEQVLEIIQAFYSGADIKDDLKREYEPGVKKHFLSKKFEYTVTIGRILSFMLFTIIITLAFIIIFSLPHQHTNDALVWIIILPACFFLFGINWLLFINYWLHDKNILLKISQGQDKFLFGTRLHYKEYNKRDINRLLTYSANAFSGSNRLPWLHCETYRIVFNNGEERRRSLFVALAKVWWDFYVCCEQWDFSGCIIK